MFEYMCIEQMHAYTYSRYIHEHVPSALGTPLGPTRPPRRSKGPPGAPPRALPGLHGDTPENPLGPQGSPWRSEAPPGDSLGGCRGSLGTPPPPLGKLQSPRRLPGDLPKRS